MLSALKLGLLGKHFENLVCIAVKVDKVNLNCNWKNVVIIFLDRCTTFSRGWPHWQYGSNTGWVSQTQYVVVIYTGDPRTCAIFILAWASNWGSSGFPRNQNKSGSSGAYVTCIYRSLSMKVNTCKMLHGARRSWAHLFCVCGRPKPEDPQFEPHSWRRHYTGRYRRSGISRVYLWLLYKYDKGHWLKSAYINFSY